MVAGGQALWCIIDHGQNPCSNHQLAAPCSPLLQFAEEMMLVALHLFDVPDTDFALQFGDSCPFEGMPVLGEC